MAQQQPPPAPTEPHLRSGDVVTEFRRLSDNAQTLFNTLRELPQFGQRHWQAYFAKAFDLYASVDVCDVASGYVV